MAQPHGRSALAGLVSGSKGGTSCCPPSLSWASVSLEWPSHPFWTDVLSLAGSWGSRLVLQSSFTVTWSWAPAGATPLGDLAHLPAIRASSGVGTGAAGAHRPSEKIPLHLRGSGLSGPKGPGHLLALWTVQTWRELSLWALLALGGA